MLGVSVAGLNECVDCLRLLQRQDTIHRMGQRLDSNWGAQERIGAHCAPVTTLHGLLPSAFLVVAAAIEALLQQDHDEVVEALKYVELHLLVMDCAWNQTRVANSHQACIFVPDDPCAQAFQKSASPVLLLECWETIMDCNPLLFLCLCEHGIVRKLSAAAIKTNDFRFTEATTELVKWTACVKHALGNAQRLPASSAESRSSHNRSVSA